MRTLISLVVHPRLHTKIGLEFLLAGFEFGVRDHVGDPPLLDDIVPVRDRCSKVKILLNKDDVEPLFFKLSNRPADLLDDDWREALGGLVKQQRARAGSQDSAYREHLLLAARKL